MPNGHDSSMKVVRATTNSASSKLARRVSRRDRWNGPNPAAHRIIRGSTEPSGILRVGLHRIKCSDHRIVMHPISEHQISDQRLNSRLIGRRFERDQQRICSGGSADQDVISGITAGWTSLKGVQRCERLVDDFRRDQIAGVREAVATTSRPALAAERGVAARFAIDGVRIVAVIAADLVVAEATEDAVVALVTSDAVVRTLALERVTAVADQRVRAVAAPSPGASDAVRSSKMICGNSISSACVTPFLTKPFHLRDGVLQIHLGLFRTPKQFRTETRYFGCQRFFLTTSRSTSGHNR